jgi:hypothetical protein
VALDANNKRIPGKGMWFWPGDMTANFDPLNRKDAKLDGTENIPLNGYSYVPERGEHGKWSGCLFGRSDVFVGAGLPANEHTSWVVVFQEVAENVVVPPTPEPTSNLAFRQALIVAQAAGTRTPATIRKRVEDLLALDKAMGA